MDLRDKNDRSSVEYTLEAQTNDELNLKLLKAYLEATEKYGSTKVLKYQALKLKYEALITVPTIIEKTMSPAQLYASNSPLWTNNYIGITIERILRQLEKRPRTEESFNDALAAIFKPKTVHTDKYGKIYIN